MRRLLAALIFFTAAAWAADLRVLSVGAIEPGLGRIVDRFKSESGHVVTVQVDTAPGLTRRLGTGEAADVLIATSEVIDAAAKEGKVILSTKATVARVGIGIVVRRGATAPKIETVEAFRAALLGADSIVYNEGSSGLYLERLFERMGISAPLKTKTTRYANGGQVLQHVIDGKGNEMGFVPIPAIKSAESRGVQLAGPLPADVQNYTSYDAVVMTGSKAADAARDFVRYLTTPASRQIFSAAGVD